MDNLNIRLSEHARDVMRRRQITFDEVAEIIARPKVVTTGTDRKYSDNPTRKYFGENLCVVVAENHGRREQYGKRQTFRIVITVLLKDGEEWTDEDARGRKR